MNENDVYVRTELGNETIRTRRDSFPPDLRVVFFLVDGGTRACDILTQVSGLGVTAEAFDRLLAAGYVALPAPAATGPGAPAAQNAAKAAQEDERFSVARQFLRETAVNAMGIRSFFFTLKLEKAYTFQELRLLLPDYEKLIEKGAGPVEAEVLTRRARELTREAAAARKPDPARG